MNIRKLPVAYLLAVGLVAACDQDPLVLLTYADAGGTSLIARPDSGIGDGGCTQTNGGVEACDKVDNDCDGLIDEDFQLQTDVDNCGTCGNSCRRPGSLTRCELGKCQFLGCAPGFVDSNSDPADGCDYECTPTGDEICDGKDNDCNGETDELFDLTNDVDNCGQCGKVCLLANAIPRCEDSACRVVRCEPGFFDADDDPANGCEELCTLTNDGVEICDHKDNDCNGIVDDPGGVQIDTTSDVLNCGGCGIFCAFPNALPTCTESHCQIASCTGNYVDGDGALENGCECLPDGPEVCDGVDNDCNGATDDHIAGLPRSCGTDDGECIAGQVTCENGIELCRGVKGPETEYCDGKDTDCDLQLDAPQCVFAAAGREQRLDEPGSSVLGEHNSIQLSIAGHDSRLLAAWLDRRDDNGDIYLNISENGGVTWRGSDIAALKGDYSGTEPQLALGGPTSDSVRAYIAYERFSDSGQRDVMILRSRDGGETWTRPAHVEFVDREQGDALFARIAVRPGVDASSPDTVVVCWERIALIGLPNPNIRCNISLDSGVTFASANDIQVNTIADTALLPQLALDDTHAYLAWQQGDRIRVARAALTTPLAFGDETVLSADTARQPTIAADGSGRVVVAWEDLRDAQINVRANRSLNHGAAWLSDGARVDNDVVDGNSTTPSIAMRPGGIILIAWADTNRGRADIYLNTSTDGGASYGSRATQVNADTAGKHTSAEPVIVVGVGHNVYAAWRDYRGGRFSDVYFGLSLDDGTTWNVPDYRLDESASGEATARNPLLYVGPGPTVGRDRVAAVWIDNRTSSGPNGPNGDIYSSYVE